MDLKDKLKESQEQHIEVEDNRDKPARLYELGIIDSNGDYIVKRYDDLIDKRKPSNSQMFLIRSIINLRLHFNVISKFC